MPGRVLGGEQEEGQSGQMAEIYPWKPNKAKMGGRKDIFFPPVISRGMSGICRFPLISL